MTYVMANLHGEYQRFQDLLSKIRFRDTDILYILGDIVDYGSESMELIADLSVRTNVYSIAGEHDFLAARMLTELDKMLREGSAPDPEIMAEMAAWMQDGGEKTITAFRALDEEQREGVLDYLCDLALFEEAEVKGESYLMVHAGIADYKAGSDIEDYLPEEFFTETPDPEYPLVEDTTLIVGHAPTKSGKIERGEGTIYLHCGVEDGGKLACLCLETQREYYA